MLTWGIIYSLALSLSDVHSTRYCLVLTRPELIHTFICSALIITYLSWLAWPCLMELSLQILARNFSVRYDSTANSHVTRLNFTLGLYGAYIFSESDRKYLRRREISSSCWYCRRSKKLWSGCAFVIHESIALISDQTLWRWNKLELSRKGPCVNVLWDLKTCSIFTH